MRKTVIAGNWKMNMTPSAARAFITELAPMVKGKDKCDIVLCVPFVDLPVAIEAAKGTNVHIGAQNVHFEKKGAFTGEISTGMLLDAGAKYVIIGHSERRQYFGETDATVNSRLQAALKAGLKPIVCIGETLAEREGNKTNCVLATQLRGGLADISADVMKDIVLAYEPVWAIGTGKTATPEMAEETHAFIRKELTAMFGKECAELVRIQYGGSMKGENAASLVAQADIDGGLIGGASLKAGSFAELIANAIA